MLTELCTKLDAMTSKNYQMKRWWFSYWNLEQLTSSKIWYRALRETTWLKKKTDVFVCLNIYWKSQNKFISITMISSFFSFKMSAFQMKYWLIKARQKKCCVTCSSRVWTNEYRNFLLLFLHLYHARFRVKILKTVVLHQLCDYHTQSSDQLPYRNVD